jgi:hypothetical protein
MKQSIRVLAWFLVGAVSSQAAAQEGLVFTLADVDTASARPRQDRVAVDSRRPIAGALGPLHWGVSKAELISLLKAQIRAGFEQRIKVERDIMRQDAIYQEAQERARRLDEDFVAFDGPKTGWDVSPIAAEFTHGHREAMLVVAGKGTRDMYFFIQGKLWKWYRELSPEAVGAVNPEQALALVSRSFGTGRPQQDRHDESNVALPGTAWSDGTTRVTALRRGGDICLDFEDLSTLEKLPSLRYRVQPQAQKTSAASAVDSILLSDAELKARGQ